MKNAILLALMITFIAGCKKDKTEPEEKEPTLQDKIQGKWQLVRAVDEVWQPMNTLTHSEENPVGAGDSVIFRGSTVFGYSDTQTGVDVEEVDVTFTSGDLLIVDDELWFVRKLTDHELELEQVEVDTPNDRKDVLKNYLTR